MYSCMGSNVLMHAWGRIMPEFPRPPACFLSSPDTEQSATISSVRVRRLMLATAYPPAVPESTHQSQQRAEEWSRGNSHVYLSSPSRHYRHLYTLK